MYPITSKSSSGILIIFMVFSEIQSFTMENDTSQQFCSNLNVGTKERLRNFEINQGCYDKFGGLPNRLQKLPDLPQKTPREVLEIDGTLKRKISIESIENLMGTGQFRNSREKPLPSQQFAEGIRTTIDSSSRSNYRSSRGSEAQKVEIKNARTSADGFRSINRMRVTRMDRAESQSLSRNREPLVTRRVDTSRRYREDLSNLGRLSDRQLLSRTSSRAENSPRSSRTSTEFSENQREERMNTRTSANSFRLTNRIRETRHDRSEPRGPSRKSFETENSLKRSINTNRSSRTSTDVSETRREDIMNTRTSANDFRSFNAIRESRHDRAEPRSRESLETRRFTREDHGFDTTRRSRENLSNVEVFRRTSSRTRGNSGAENRLRSSRTSIEFPEARREERMNIRTSENGFRSTNRIRESRQDRSEPRSLSRSRESLETRDNSGAENRLRSSRTSTEFSEARREERMNTRTSANRFRSTNGIRESRQIPSEPRSLSRSRESLETRDNSGAENRLRSSRTSTEFSEARREESMNSRTSENGFRSTNRIRESRQDRSEPRSLSRSRESLETRDDSGAENRLRSSRTSTEFSEARREKRMNTRTANHFRSTNRIGESRQMPSEPRSFSRSRESLETRRFIREDPGVDTTRRSRQNLSNLGFSRSSSRDQNRSRSSRSTAGTFRASTEFSKNPSEDRMISRAPDVLRSFNRIMETRRVDSEPGSISRIRAFVETRRNTREDSGEVAASRSRESSLNLSTTSNHQRSISGSSSRADNRLRSSRTTERSFRVSTESSENRRDDRMVSRAPDVLRTFNRIMETRRVRSEPRSLSRIRESVVTRRNTREDPGEVTASRSKRSLSNLRAPSNLQLISGSSSRAGNRLRSSRSTERSIRASTEFSENRREDRMSSADYGGTRMDRSHPRSLSRENFSNLRRSFDPQLSRSSSRVENRLRISRSTHETSRTSGFSENRWGERVNSRTSADGRAMRMETPSQSRRRVSAETHRNAQDIESVRDSREFVDPPVLSRSSSRAEKRLGSSRRSLGTSTEFSENRRELRMNSRTIANDFRLSNLRRRENVMRSTGYKIEDVSKILDSRRNIRNVPEENQEGLLGTILGKYSRTGDTLEKIIPKEASAWLGTAQISLVIVLLGQLFLNGNEKKRFPSMNFVRMLKN